MTQRREFDIIIVGGGIAGMSTALSLAPLGLRLAIIDRSPMRLKHNEGFDRRVFAISLASQRLFQTLGVWERIPHGQLSPFTTMNVWMKDNEINFNCQEVYQPNLGHILEESTIYNALLAQVQQYQHIALLPEQTLSNLTQMDSTSILRTEDERAYHAKLLIGADGGESWLRQAAKIDVTRTPYPHHAMVATIKTEKPHESIARERFLSSGPLAFLPLADPHYSSIVWCQSPDNIAAIKAMEAGKFEAYLTESIEHKLGKLKLSSDRISFPLQKRHAHHYVKQGIALVGDAAHTIHPLAGQGLNIGLMDVAELAQRITHAHSVDRPIHSLHTLRKYERARRLPNLTMLSATDVFLYGFGDVRSAVAMARKLGLGLTNRVAMIKRHFIQHAQGLGGQGILAALDPVQRA